MTFWLALTDKAIFETDPTALIIRSVEDGLCALLSEAEHWLKSFRLAGVDV